MSEQRNLLLALALTIGVLVFWESWQAARAPEKPQEETTATGAPSAPSASGGVPGTSGTSLSLPAPDATPTGPSPRLTIETPSVSGSIALRGAVMDDLILSNYRETQAADSDNVHFLIPEGAPVGTIARFGWHIPGSADILPGPNALWKRTDGHTLTPETPITLTYETGGLLFERRVSVDADYMFTIIQSVENRTGAPVHLAPYGAVLRHGKADTRAYSDAVQVSGFFLLHVGLIGVFSEDGLEEIDYEDIEDDGPQRFSSKGGFLGITDKYWAAVLVPEADTQISAQFDTETKGAEQAFRAHFTGAAQALPVGGRASSTTRLFAGAKEVALIDNYADDTPIPRFDLLIDWGWFYFLTKPLFLGLDFFFRLNGNFGIAILIITVLIKLAFFPLANKSYATMAQMRRLQPEMEAVRERHKEDFQKQQEAMMALYKKEKLNPMAGCLPIFVQIPVFFALYKVLFVTIEMRHAPFFGWVQDLSAPDPTSLLTLFGLLPIPLPDFLIIGIWPILMGFTMFIQMRLNPTPPNPVQKTMMTWMPVVFTVLLARFPAGLVIYWAWNNILSVAQQAAIMKRHGASIAIFERKKTS